MKGNQTKVTGAAFTEQQIKQQMIDQSYAGKSCGGLGSALQQTAPLPTLHMLASNVNGQLHAANDKLNKMRGLLLGEGVPGGPDTEASMPPLCISLGDSAAQCEILHEQIDAILSRLG